MLAICNADVEVKHKASKPKGKNREAKSGHKKKHPFSATDTNPSQPLASTPVVARLHKEALQPTSVPTSLGVINEERADPELSRDSIVEAHPEKSGISSLRFSQDTWELIDRDEEIDDE
ncbi:hypothetical protein Tco_1550078 [Tanacetum coccineum]